MLGLNIGLSLLSRKLRAIYTGITPTFTASVTTGVAPLAVHIDASTTTAGNTAHAWRDCLFGHDSGDTAATNVLYGPRAGQLKKRLVGGPQFGHVYKTAGSYNYVGKVYDGVNWVERNIAILALDPDVVFAGTNTICCSITGNFSGAKPGASLQTVANLAAALALMATDKRVLLQSADTWTTAVTSTQSGTKDRMVLGSFGAGRALITLTSNAILFTIASANVTRLQVLDLVFNGSSGQSNIIKCNTALAYENIHIHNCHAYDIGGVLVTAGTSVLNKLAITETLLERVTGGGGFCGVFACARNAVLQDFKVDVCTAAEHNVRFQYLSNSFINACALSGPAVNKNALTIRAPLWAGGTVVGLPANSYTEYNTVSDCDLGSNTPYMVTITPQASNSDERIRRVIFERNYVYAMGPLAANGLLIAAQECVSRNNVFNLTGGAAYGSGPSIIANSTFTSDGNESWNDTVYSSSVHNTLVGFGATSGAATNSKLKSMVMYTPATTTVEVIGSTAVASTTGTNNPTNANAKTVNPLFVGPPTSAAGFALGASSPYATFAVLGRNYSDLFDKQRGTNGGAAMLASNTSSAWDLFQ